MVQWYGAHRPAVMGARAMVSSTHYLATTAGVEILKAGGNSIDAGVAVGLCINVLEPHLTNLAGVAPIMTYDAATRQVETISGLGRWPAAISIDSSNLQKVLPRRSRKSAAESSTASRNQPRPS